MLRHSIPRRGRFDFLACTCYAAHSDTEIVGGGHMSVKARIGKEWVKARVELRETGECLHLAFGPGETSKRVYVTVDGVTEVGTLSLEGLSHTGPDDATVSLTIPAHAAKKGPAAKQDVRKVAPETRGPSEVRIVNAAAGTETVARVIADPGPVEKEEPVTVKEPAPAVEESTTSGRGGRRKGTS